MNQQQPHGSESHAEYRRRLSYQSPRDLANWLADEVFGCELILNAPDLRSNSVLRFLLVERRLAHAADLVDALIRSVARDRAERSRGAR
jgi:hypothetical protein